MRFGPQVCTSLSAGASREWLVTDGFGGYAMGTVSGLRTRRYHALLMVASGDSRRAGLVALDPVVNGIRLATHEWADGTIAPSGHTHLAEFALIDGLPRWRWRVGGILLERTLRTVPHGVIVRHRLLAGGPVELSLEALCVWRDQHGEQQAGPMAITPTADGAEIAGAYRLRGPQWTPDGTWLLGVHYREETARGYTDREDVLLAGRFNVTLDTGDSTEVTAWAGDLLSAKERKADLAEPFIVEGPDVIAGYPWFGSWSRDTMISYEGLFLSTGRVEIGRSLLQRYAGMVSEGMLPNTAGGFNTADASLWFLHAVERHVHHTGDTDLAVELLPTLDEIIAAHLHGTRYGIRVAEDGLLSQGAPGEALTWMDARVDGEPVTRRGGKAVDINALWCNGLAAVATLHRDDASGLWQLHDRAKAAFGRSFPCSAGYLLDTVDDASLRPNQLLAYSLPYAPLDPDPHSFALISEALLTPLGLRTLAPADPRYRGSHHGTLRERDLAYHQGTVWPWLMGPYADVARLLGIPTDGLFDPLMAHLSEWGLGSVSETADGDTPHLATGCPFQAWSVAELLRSTAPTGED